MAVLAAGLAYSLFLLGQVQDEVFYSGDGGIKSLMVKQYARGDFSVEFRPAAPHWAKRLWEQGLYPFRPPFVYSTPRGIVTSFPVFFPLLTVPFYLLFGNIGYYVVPAISLWLIWLLFLSCCRRMGTGGRAAAASLAVLIFSSPLTLYGAMFWEHTLGVLLTFCGVRFLILAPDDRSRIAGFLWGLVTSLSVWFRSEALCMVVIYGTMAGYLSVKQRKTDAAYFLTGLAAGVLALGAVNAVFYGHPLGSNSFQVLGKFSLDARLEQGNFIFFYMIISLFKHLPVLALVVPGALVLYLIKPEGTPRETWLVAIACLAFVAISPLVLPNVGGKQWGPRYLLHVVPPSCLLLAAILQVAGTQKSMLLKGTVIIAALALTLWGGWKNDWEGAVDLKNDYRYRVKPALDFIMADDHQAIAADHQFILQELAAEFRAKPFFLLRGHLDLAVLSEGLTDQGLEGFLLITNAGKPRHDWYEIPFKEKAPLLKGLRLEHLGSYGHYDIFNARILRH